MKPGYRTTEFWVSVGLFLYSQVHASGLCPEGSHSDLCRLLAALAPVVYVAGRAYAKGQAPPGPPEAPRP